MNFIEDYFLSIVGNKSPLKKIENFNESMLYDFYQQLNFNSHDLLIVLEELLINCVEHGQSDTTFYFDKKFDIHTFAVCDSGQGIHTTVPKNINLKDIKGKSSTSIIRLSLEEGITGTSKIGRGMGLHYLSKLVSQKNATALISSNSGLVIQQGDYFSEKKLNFEIAGNIIILQIHKKELGL